MPIDPMLRLKLTFPHTLTDMPAEACTSATSLLFNEKPPLLKSSQLDVLVRHIHHTATASDLLVCCILILMLLTRRYRIGSWLDAEFGTLIVRSKQGV